MAQQTILEVVPRTVLGKANKHLRQAGIIPANIYGHKEASQAVQVDEIAFTRLQHAHGSRNILSLRLPGVPAQTALIRHVARDPISGRILHIDFARVGLRERIESRIPLHFVGVAPGVKVQGGVLLHLLENIPVECSAENLVESIEVDITPLDDIDSILYARDIKLPDGYTLVADPEEPVVKVAPPRVEAAPPAAAAETPAAEAPAAAAETTES